MNTEGRETFPFVTDSNELFYASDGHSGLGGLGNDDIYALQKEIIPPCYQTITGIVKDIDTEEIIPGATVQLKNIENEVLATVTSDEKGQFNFPERSCETPFVIRAIKDSYEMSEGSISTNEEPDGTVQRDLYLKPLLQLKVGDDLAKVLNLILRHIDDFIGC